MTEAHVGAPIDRVDGVLKVTGAAKFTADLPVADLAHARLIQSTTASGKLLAVDTEAAEAVPGVVIVLTGRNAPHLAVPSPETGGMSGEKRSPLSDDAIAYDGQVIAVVVADTFETARYAASLVTATYEKAAPVLAYDDERAEHYQPAQRFGQALQAERGNAALALALGAAAVDATYGTPREHHNPMEPHATTAQWHGDQLTVYDATQGGVGCQKRLAAAFRIRPEDVRVVSHFVGGGFGCKGSVWPHVFLAAMAARVAKRPVKLVVSRQQMFTNNGYRPSTVQRVRVSADADGKLSGISFDVKSCTSRNDEFIESSAFPVKSMYACDNLRISETLARLNYGAPTFMRAPGESTGSFGMECAMDELAHALGMDPVKLRLRNLPAVDPDTKKPWSSYHVRECFEKAGEAFGWRSGPVTPGQARDGRLFVGTGVAMATYPAHKSQASAKAQLFADGRALVESATQDIGTGTYTVMTQIAADALGLPLDRVRFDLGSSAYPEAPVSGGSQTAASVGPAVRAACEALRLLAVDVAVKDHASPLFGADPARVIADNGRLYMGAAPSKADTYADILRRGGLRNLAAASARQEPQDKERKKPGMPGGKGADDDDRYAHRSFGAVYAEVKVDPDSGEVRLTRFVGCFDGGRILNQKTARSQLLGGMIWALGMALLEETVADARTGRYVTRNLADYRIPVNADVQAIQALVLDVPDPHFTSMGARGIGEIGITGGAAAIANAVFQATGKRIRDLPITPDKVLA